MKLDYGKEIAQAVKDTRERWGGREDIIDAVNMIPHMPEEAAKGIRKMLDVAYSEEKDAKMDLYFPENQAEKAPVFIEVHGGAWFFGQKSSVEFQPFLYGLERGFVVISLGYTLAPQGHYPLPVVQIRKAIKYLKEHAEELGIDAEEITILGGSAGAHLAGLACLSAGDDYLKEYVEKDEALVKNLILWFGCFNYLIGKRLEAWQYRNFFGDIDENPKAYQDMLLSNPALHVSDKMPRTLLVHGSKDGLVSYEQSVAMYGTMKAIGGEEKVELRLKEGWDHADLPFFQRENIVETFDWIQGK